MNKKDLMPKFYTLEDMTQEDLNKLSLERNTFAKEISRLNNIIDEKDTEITILNNKLNMIKENVEYLLERKDKQQVIDIIEKYTGFWGKSDKNE